jgi:two-component system, OmpR family, sensor histidine kinase KdpD
MNTLRGVEKRLVVLIDEEVRRLSDLTTRLLRTARMDNANLKLKRERIPLLRLIQDSVAECSQELGVHPVTIQPDPQRSTVYADRQLLKMALSQLFDNAAKYGSQESPITIEVQEEQAEVVISVRNEGSFIPLEERENIFRRFYRSPGSNLKAPGTGIGLSVVRQVTEAHKGRAWVNSDQHAGTTFFVTLPRAAKEE